MNWIKIEDKVPEFGKTVLLFGAKGSQELAQCGSLESIDKHGYNWKIGDPSFNDIFGGFGRTSPAFKFIPTYWCEIIPPKE